MKEKLTNYLIDLVKINSVIGNEKEIADYVEKFLKDKVKNIIRLNNSLIAFNDLEQNKKTIGFVGHLDTVPAENDLTGQIIDNKLYGLGASDMKGGLAVMMGLLDFFKDKESRFNTIYIFYEKEEGAYNDNGLQPLLEEYKDLLQNIDFAFVLEPTNNEVQVGAVGTINVEINFKGKKSHSARPWYGENAIHKSWKFIKRVSEFGVKEYPFKFSLGDKDIEITFYEVMNITVAKSEGARNVIPDNFKLNVNYRFSPSKTLEEAKKDIIDIVENEAEIDFVDLAPPGKVPTNNPILIDFIKRYSIPVKPKQAWTDVARLSIFGIEGVNFGPGEPSQAHQRNEYIPIENLVKNFEYLKDFLLV
ncbi:MAG: succinyl-diaminopimelate desuccinylase [Persephonella sp.]|nr:MAG: succinyl-diaminopimelate desuccinylase [Persephonella sp.]RUM58335.1 MAG: succinyl-diaminopimelate desuccinylase [Persephonella sp.]